MMDITSKMQKGTTGFSGGPRESAPGFSAPPQKGTTEQTTLSQKSANYTKESMGIACCRINNRIPEILAVCKRVTYAYNIFTFGRYNATNYNVMMRLFNGMMLDEKHTILSLNFVSMWYRLWLGREPTSAAFFVAKYKFEKTFLADGGVKLKRLIARSKHAQPIWEIPKGKKKSGETNIACAMREFYEETGVAKKDYRFMTSDARTYSYIDDHVKYTNHYYLAFMDRIMTPVINFALTEQTREIADIQWVDITRIRILDSSGRLANFVGPIFKQIKLLVK